MSITIHVKNDTKINVSDPCICTNGFDRESCSFCKGTGIYIRKEYPIEANWCHSTLISFLRLINMETDDDYFGELDPVEVMQNMRGYRLSTEWNPHSLKMMALCNRAISLNSTLVWG